MRPSLIPSPATVAAWLAGLILLVGCDRCAPRAAERPAERPGEDVPIGPLRDRTTFVQLAVYLPDKSGDDLREVASRHAVIGLPRLPIAPSDAKSPKPPWLMIDVPPIAEYAPPDAARMRYSNRGVEQGDWPRVSAAQQVVVLTMAVPAPDADARHRELLALVAKLAELWQGFPWDNETRQVYSRQAWAGDRLSWQDGPPNVAAHVNLHAYREGELIRIVTLGMSKLGYPDLVANDVPQSMLDSMGSLIKLAAQTLVERNVITTHSQLELSIETLTNVDAKAFQHGMDVGRARALGGRAT